MTLLHLGRFKAWKTPRTGPAPTETPRDEPVPLLHAVVAAYTVEGLAPVTFAEASQHERTDIIVLTTDDPATVCAWRRASRATIVAITSHAASGTDRARLLDAGADLCLHDPSSSELAAHLRALRRRLSPEA